MPNAVLAAVVSALALAVVATLLSAFFTVEQRNVAIVQRLGRFVREAGPGLHAKIPFIDRVIGRINLRVQQLDVKIGASSRTNAILIPHSPGNLTTLTEQMRNAMIEADQTVSGSESRPRPVASLPATSGNGGAERGDS